MSNIHSKDTKPELLVARELRRRKIYFARNVKSLIGKPDIVFRKKKVILFIDSDFWHGHPKRCIMPKSNKRYWNKKIKYNIIRDKEVKKQLKRMGWKVIRIWEYDINHSINKSLARVFRVLRVNK